MGCSAVGVAMRAKRHAVAGSSRRVMPIAERLSGEKGRRLSPILLVQVVSPTGLRSLVLTIKRQARVLASSGCYGTGRGSGGPITAITFRSFASLASLDDVRARTLRPATYFAVQLCTLGRPTTIVSGLIYSLSPYAFTDLAFSSSRNKTFSGCLVQ